MLVYFCLQKGVSFDSSFGEYEMKYNDYVYVSSILLGSGKERFKIFIEVFFDWLKSIFKGNN